MYYNDDIGARFDLFEGVAHSHSAYGYFVYKYVKHTYRLIDKNSTSSSFYYMLEKYGLQSAVSAGGYNIAAEPLYFVRSGYLRLYLSNNTFGAAGINGYLWSSRTYSSVERAYDLKFDANVSLTTDDSNRHLGNSLRCLSTVLDI